MADLNPYASPSPGEPEKAQSSKPEKGLFAARLAFVLVFVSIGLHIYALSQQKVEVVGGREVINWGRPAMAGVDRFFSYGHGLTAVAAIIAALMMDGSWKVKRWCFAVIGMAIAQELLAYSIFKNMQL